MTYNFPELFHHYKGERLKNGYYLAKAIVHEHETNREFVLYRDLDGGGNRLFIRPLSDFTEMVVNEAGENVPRFRLVDSLEGGEVSVNMLADRLISSGTTREEIERIKAIFSQVRIWSEETEDRTDG